jgi:hypothetical protein
MGRIVARGRRRFVFMGVGSEIVSVSQAIETKSADLTRPSLRHREAPPRKTRQAAPIGATANVFLGQREIRGFEAIPVAFVWSQKQIYRI